MTSSLDRSAAPPRLVILDMAGTTVHDEDFVNATFREALAAAGLGLDRDVVNAVMGWPKPTAVRHLLATTRGDVDDDEAEAIHADFLARMNAFYATDPRVQEVEGATATLRRLRDAGIRVALDTGFSRSTADLILDRLGWVRDGLVDATVTSDEVSEGRPAPDMIHHLMARLEIDDARSVAKVGDTPSDLEEGTRAGCGFVIGVTEGTHQRDELLAHPHTHLIPSVAHLPALLLSAVNARL